MKYFAYGSNMSLRRLQQRVPSAQSLGTYSLEKHNLRFHKSGKDGSGKCDAYYTGNKFDVVLGVLYEMEESEKLVLDETEGLGHGYVEKVVCVSAAEGDVVASATYCAIRIDESLLPYTWYKEHVMVGAREANLPPEYIAIIEAVQALKDPDKKREAGQRAIHRNHKEQTMGSTVL